jgi:murein DD-endopeptidase MepM/ murein hydrolase activator NlpD
MKTTINHRARILPVLAVVFGTGMLAGWWLHDHPPLPVQVQGDGSRVQGDGSPSDSIGTPVPRPATPVPRTPALGRPVATTGEPTISAAPPPLDAAIEDLQRRGLRVPIDGLDIEQLKGGFTEHRAGDGGHTHEAVDILAPRNTPVHAVQDGTIAKLFFSKAGGNTIYQFDPAQQFCYYYAHLERYADGVRDGLRVSRGDVIGYVGTSGNAPPGTPHLHFAVYELTPEHRWWQGHPLDPYLVFRR